MLPKVKVHREVFFAVATVTIEHRHMHELVSETLNGLHILFSKDGLKMKSKFYRVTKLSHLSTNLLILARTGQQGYKIYMYISYHKERPNKIYMYMLYRKERPNKIYMYMFYHKERQTKIYMYMSYHKERQNSTVVDPEFETLGVLDKMKNKKKQQILHVFSHGCFLCWLTGFTQ